MSDAQLTTLSPDLEIAGLVRDRAEGKINDRDWVSRAEPRIQQLHSQPRSATQPTLPPQELSARLEQLRQLRIDGKAMPAEMREFERLAAIEAGEEPSVDQTSFTMDEQVQSQLDAMMAPAQPHDYEFQYHGEALSEEAQAWDSGVRNLFVDVGLPKHLGPVVFDAINRNADSLGVASEDVKMTKIQNVVAQLRQLWGTECDTRINAIDNLIFTATEKHPKFADIVYSQPWLLADASIWNALDSILTYRAHRNTR